MTELERYDRQSRRTIGLLIEGVGNDTAKSKGLVFYNGSRLPSGYFDAQPDYEWTPGLVDIPDTIDSSLSPFTGKIRAGGVSLSLPMTDLVARSLFYRQGRTNLTNGLALNTVQTALWIDGDDKSGLSGSVVWIEDEAILMGTEGSPGQYTSCTRGYWSTIAAEHPLDVYVYTGNPFTLDRRATLVIYDARLGTISERFYFVDDIGTNDEGTTAEIDLSDFLSLLVGAQINQGATPVTISGAIDTQPGFLQEGGRVVARFDEADKVIKEPSGTARRTWWGAADTVHLGTTTDDVTQLAGLSGPIVWPGAPPAEADPDAEFNREPFMAVGHQLFMVRESPINPDSNDWSSSIGLGDNYRNVIALAQGFMRSGYAEAVDGFDAWKGQFGAGFPPSFFDEVTTQITIDKHQEAQVDMLILGWEGEEVSISDLVIDRLLVPYGFLLASNQDNTIAIRSFDLLTVEDFANAGTVDPLPPKLGWKIPREGEFSRVVADIGETPWNDPDHRIVESRDGFRRDSQRRAVLSSRNELTLDLSTRAKGTADADIIPDLLSRAQRGIDQTPQLTIDVSPTEVTGVTYDLLTWVTINTPPTARPWFLDSNGDRVGLDPTNPALAGLIVSRKESLESGRFELGLLLLNYENGDFIRWRAPSASIVSYDNAGPYLLTVEQNVFNNSAADASFFTIGDHVEIYYPDLELVALGLEDLVVGGVSGNVIELDAPTGVTVTAGMILRLSTLGNDATSGPFNPYRAHVFASETVTDDPGDIYG